MPSSKTNYTEQHPHQLHMLYDVFVCWRYYHAHQQDNDVIKNYSRLAAAFVELSLTLARGTLQRVDCTLLMLTVLKFWSGSNLELLGLGLDQSCK